MEAKFLAGALSFLSIFLAIYAQSLAVNGNFNNFDSEASTEFDIIEPVVIYYGDSNVNMGEPFSITCIIPITEKIHWLKNGEPITRHNLRHGRDEHAYTLAESAIEGEKHKIEAHISVRHALKVHEGRYQCNDKHSSYHMLHVRNVPVVTKPQTKSPFIITASGGGGSAGEVTDDQRHYPTESGYQTIHDLTPSAVDDIFTRAWEHPGPDDIDLLPPSKTTHHHNNINRQQQQQQQLQREHERRMQLYANASVGHGISSPPRRTGESDKSNELLGFPFPTSKYNDLTTMPWQVMHGGSGINRVYSATPPDFPPPRITMLEHTVAPPDAPAIYYPRNKPTTHHTETPYLTGTTHQHQHQQEDLITANSGVGFGLGSTGIATETQQPQQTHHYTLTPASPPPPLPHGTANTNIVVSHHAHAHLQPQLSHHHHQQQPQQSMPPQPPQLQQYPPHTQLQAPQPPIIQQTPPFQTINPPYQQQPPRQSALPPYYQYNPSSAYPPQFVTAIALPPSPGVGMTTSYTAAATVPTTNFNAKQQAKTFLPLKKDSDILVPNYDYAENQLKFFGIRDPLVLSCNVKGNSSHVLQWLKNDTDVSKVDSLRGRFRIIEAEGKFIIDKTDTNDDGVYSCKIGDVKKDINAVARVIVRVPSNSGVVEGEKLSIVCSVVGTKPILSWTYGNLTLTNSTDRYILKPDENHIENAILSVENISLDDRGEYKCIGRNDANKYGDFNDASDVSFVRVKGKLAALWPFLGICAEVLILCLIILIYETRRNKSELEESDTDPQEQKKKRRNYD